MTPRDRPAADGDPSRVFYSFELDQAAVADARLAIAVDAGLRRRMLDELARILRERARRRRQADRDALGGRSSAPRRAPDDDPGERDRE